MGEVVVLNEIPDVHGNMKVIEGVLSEALANRPGSWTVKIHFGTWPQGSWVPAATAERWAIVVARDGEPFKRTLLVDPKDQRPEHIAAFIPELLLARNPEALDARGEPQSS
jgi:hypothetical protein